MKLNILYANGVPTISPELPLSRIPRIWWFCRFNSEGVAPAREPCGPQPLQGWNGYREVSPGVAAFAATPGKVS